MTVKEAKDIVGKEFDVHTDSETITSVESHLEGYKQALLDVKTALIKSRGSHFRVISLYDWINEKLDKDFNNEL